MTEELSRKRKIVRRAATALVGVAFCALLFEFVAVPRISSYATARHQRSTTRELAEWANEYGKPQNDNEASRAVDMLEYIPTYYVPQDGYQSDPATEAALEQQRANTIAAIVDGLRDLSGQDFGNDASQWRTWLATRKRVK